MWNTFNSLSDLFKLHPFETLTYEDVNFKNGTGSDVSTYKVGSDGRKHRDKFIYRLGVQTNVGDIREDAWLQLTERMIYREYEGWLLDSLDEWYSEHGWQVHIKTYQNNRDKKADIHKSALHAVISRLYDNEGWVDYIPFNKKYRPSALEGKVFLNIIPSCCNKPGQVSPKVNHYGGRYPCPHCGGWAIAEILGVGSFDEKICFKTEG